MAERLMQHLLEKSKEHLHLKLLQSQWSFDEKLIPKALQNVVAMFPHYSRHDVSHSQQILINIERLLGDRVTSLTATDTWLLLEAAYWHDIGMVVTANDIAKDMQSDEFKQYISDIAFQDGHELQGFAKKFSSLNPQTCFSSAETPQQAMGYFQKLLADWYRINHPVRAAKVIDEPWENAGISSPRNELVPRRLFRLLGQICRLHGSNFESIMESLPFCEAGMATEDCHPRFVACLLRLGDLFDLDDNRFCPVMLQVAGELPDSSLKHFEKHLSIRHFRLDTDCVEIVAECPNYKAYEVTDQWFRWIEDELRNQMTRWKDIVPNRQIGLLPTLGRFEVNIEPPYEIIDPGQRPRFGVDPQKTIELLRGAGLYRDNLQSLRELLQNAVDASLIRIWLSHGENPNSDDGDIDWDDPLSEKIEYIFNLYPIKVYLYRLPEKEPGRVPWQLDIRDNGIGISKQDLKFMKSVGASAKNTDRKKIINRMPKWMQPSGEFGIGLQSAFLVSPEVEIETKSLLTGESLKIKMKSPIEEYRGAIYIQKHTQPPGQESGTTLSLVIDAEAKPQKVRVSFVSPDDSFTGAILADFDPIAIAVNDIPYEIARMVDEISEFSNFSPLSIHLKIGKEPIIEKKLIRTSVTSDRENFYFHPESGIMLVNPKFISHDHTSFPIIAFRGQHIEKYKPKLPFISFQVADILAESAQDILTINRNDIKESAHKHVNKLIVDAITGYLGSQDCQVSSPEEKAAASAFLVWYEKEDRCKELKDQWRKITLTEDKSSISEICKKNTFEIYIRDHRATVEVPQGSTDSWVVRGSEMNSPRYRLLLKHWKDSNGYVQQKLNTDWTVLFFSKKELPPFENNSLKKTILDLAQERIGRVGGRCSMPAWKEYETLSVENGHLGWSRSISYYHPFQHHFVLPFFFAEKRVTTDRLDQLCTWTMEHNISPDIKEADIRTHYNNFITWIDEEVMKDSDEWKKLRNI